MPWARASSLHRQLECPASVYFPQADRGEWRPGFLGTDKPDGPAPPEDTSAADWGTEMHLAMERSPDASEPWISYVEPHRTATWPWGTGEHEVSASYDCRTGSVELFRGPRGEADAWKRSRGPDTVTGTNDWVSDLAGIPWIGDLKTGWGRVYPRDNVQLLFGLLTHPSGLQWVHGGHVSILWLPRRTNPTPGQLFDFVEPQGLLQFRRDLHAAWERAVVRGERTPIPGPHCNYCPSAQVCPAFGT